MGKVNEEQMTAAINAHLTNNMSLDQCVAVFGVKKTTLSDRINNRYKSTKQGPSTKLSEYTEKMIVTLLMTCSDIGFSLNKSQALDLIESYLESSDQTELFKNGRPSDDWYYSFLKRHKELAVRTSNNMPANRALSTDEELFECWYEKVKKVYDEKLFHERPCHIFNSDEIGMICDQGKFKVITRKGSKSAKIISNSNDKLMFTVLVCCSASGEFLPPHCVYKGQRLRLPWTQGGKDDTTFGCTASG